MKELEEAIKVLKRDINTPLACGDTTIVCISDLETVVQALENYQIKELQFLNNNLDNISATELQTILQPYYTQKENLKHKDKIINKLKIELENSISKEVIKEKIEEVRKMKFEDERLNGATIDFAACKFEEILEGEIIC